MGLLRSLQCQSNSRSAHPVVRSKQKPRAIKFLFFSSVSMKIEKGMSCLFGNSMRDNLV